jgi:RNA polymerase sigma-70 factor (ECF subfamily)
MLFRDEKDLIEACKRGDSSAFKQIYEMYKDKVFSLSFYMTRDKEAAKDITQQIFMRVFTSILTFQHKASFGSWLFRLAVNVCHDYQRSARRMKMFSTGVTDSVMAYEPAPTVEESLCKEHALEMVQRVVMKLSPKLRTVVVLKYIEDLSYSQIAELLGCSIGTVSSRLNRSHKILAEELKEFKHFF